MGQILWLIIALALGAILGTEVRPGIPEIVIVTFLFVGCAFGYRSLSQRRKRTAI